MLLVILESPYAGEIAINVEYAQKCVADCFKRGEALYASHLLYTQNNVLDNANPDQRALGIEAGLYWGDKVDKRLWCILTRVLAEALLWR